MRPDNTHECEDPMPRSTSYVLVALAAALLPLNVVRAAEPLFEKEADVCVYGGTSGGVVAAVQAARMGKRVALLEPGRHLGGMTSGGLSAVDIGDPRSVGGIAREYFTRLVASYGKKLNWDQPFRGHGPATGGAYSIEPHVAAVFHDDDADDADPEARAKAQFDSYVRYGRELEQMVNRI